MTHATRRPLALLAISAIVGAALLALAAPAVANASTASSIAVIRAALDDTRTSLGSGTTDFLSNGFVSAYAQEKAASYASCGSCAATSATADALPASSGPAARWAAELAVTNTDAADKIATALTNVYTGSIVGADNYVGIGYVVKGSHTYAYIVGVEYASAPQERIAPGKITLPTTVTVGKAIVPSITGFTPTTAGRSYVWERNGTDVGFGTTYTPTAVDLAAAGRFTLLVSASESGYLTVSATSNTTDVVKAGTITAPASPAVSGKRYVGQVLTGSAAGWTSGSSISAQWLRNNVPIPGAVFGNYTLAAADKGKKIDFQLKGTIAGYISKTVRTHTTTVIAPPFIPTAPIPAVFSTGQFNSNAGLITAPWGPGTVALHYQWRVNGVAISGATHSVYLIGAATIGKSLTVSITGTETGYTSVTRTSAPITPTALSFSTAPPFVTVTGSFTVGHTVTSAHGTWAPTPTSYAYQWYLGSAAIAHATSASYKIPASAAGHVLTVRVTAIRSGYHSTYSYGPSTTVAP